MFIFHLFSIRNVALQEAHLERRRMTPKQRRDLVMHRLVHSLGTLVKLRYY